MIHLFLWSVVFCDYQSVLLSGSELCNKIMLGHQRKDEEEYKELEESLAKKNLPLNHFLFSDSEEQYPFLKKERYELDELRKKSLKNLNEEEDKITLEGNY